MCLFQMKGRSPQILRSWVNNQSVHSVLIFMVLQSSVLPLMVSSSLTTLSFQSSLLGLLSVLSPRSPGLELCLELLPWTSTALSSRMLACYIYLQ